MKKWVVWCFIVCGILFIGLTKGYAEEEIKPVRNQLIIVNKAVNQLAFYEDGELIRVLPVATGATTKLTPEGEFEVIKLIKNQPYYKLKIPGGDPRNPLGPRWIGLNVPGTWGYTYGIHGNNAPWTIGTYASAGCVRMYNEDVTWLYGKVELGAKVIITRSSGKFEDIARNKGYQMVEDKAKASQSRIVISKAVQVYKRPSKYYETVGEAKPETLKVKKKYKNWYYIEQGKVKGWVKDLTINELNTPIEVMSYHFKAVESKKGFTFQLSQYARKANFFLNQWTQKVA